MLARMLSRTFLALGLVCGALGLIREIFGVAIGFPSGPQFSLRFINAMVAFLVGILLIAAGAAIGAHAPRELVGGPAAAPRR
jgi:hypothetical protein